MISSLLIANRGEIARRIERTASTMGLRTIAVHSEADAGMPFVREADIAVAIGPAPAQESYLVPEKILAVARKTGADAIHPGYGFLSENAEFAQLVLDAGLVWVGAPPAAIRAMGLKDAAKALMMTAGVPVTPGYLGEDQSPERLQVEADGIGYPVLIKAVAGGGGKGMRRVDAHADFAEALASCRREAAASFGDDRVLLEKYIVNPRHIEVQVFGDTHGRIVHLFERDCSLQRRHQKVIEEAPAPGMDATTRAVICEAAVKAARSVNYVGAGTIEFIADASEGLRSDRIWFMEMNTRLQVEHPVTEAITGQDLVEWQLRVAAGEPLPLTQDALSISGHAVEARLYAENPRSGFLPSIGPLTHLRLPQDIRVDSGVEEGDEVTPHYDPMIAKLIVHSGSRRAAAKRLARACRSVEVWPVKTNAAFLARALDHPEFLFGRIDTGFIARHQEALVPPGEAGTAVLHSAAQVLVGSGAAPWEALRGFRLNGPPVMTVALEIEGRAHFLDLAAQQPATCQTRYIFGQDVVFADGDAWAFSDITVNSGAVAREAADGAILTPMPGRIVALAVANGEMVVKGQALLTVEAMKMEHRLLAPFDGMVGDLHLKLGDQVGEGTQLLCITRLAATESADCR
ncbi:3-methylcrotonyl-CoA carboxylase alpha subunit [Rhodoligotrophos appendicifer]|uniref:acetyl/propionyl/methylcrotonyl-CoA carboxylase subunit alpha n=1 Tax=Rhodoligotrophos appendicifer TaxID=987056 RepID=UPI0011867905|nr:biotin carboxylase N-terminal domain-containing protein [Rhodoligotrophos appendicifer]